MEVPYIKSKSGIHKKIGEDLLNEGRHGETNDDFNFSSTFYIGSNTLYLFFLSIS